MGLLEGLTGKTEAMVEALAVLVEAESPSSDLEATSRCSEVVADLGSSLLATDPRILEVDGRKHIAWTFGEATKVLLLGHFDTVWPVGTIARWPFGIIDDRATGPGIFDMKAGIVQGLFALSELPSLDGVSVLLTSDEEVGSLTSSDLIEEAAKDAEAVLVLEPSSDGALKLARKGTASFVLNVTGKAAHAGLEPEKGINALVESAHQVLSIERMARPADGTTVSPTVASAGTTTNTIPEHAEVHINLRAWTTAEMDRVAEELDSLQSHVDGTALSVSRVSWRPPMERSASEGLFEIAQVVAKALDLGPLEGTEVGGGSDGNITAALGIPTLDGLGAVGDGAHAENEHVIVEALPQRAALLAGLVQRLTD